MPHLIYCAGHGKRFARIAVEGGYLYGYRSDSKPSESVSMVDLNWKRPDLERHAAAVEEHRPLLAVAPDVLGADALPETLRYAERLARHAERVIIVPKCPGVIERLPREPWLVLGYSVPTRYGGADAVLVWEFGGWPVHLLGGSPQAQLTLAAYLDVFSADGNAHQRAAMHGTYWSAARRGWVSRDAEGMPRGADLPYRAFARSCAEIRRAWRVI